MNRLQRAWRHLTHTPWHVKRWFSDAALDRIEAVVTAGEARHSAELRLVIEGSLNLREVLLADRQPRERAVELFADLHVWDTEANNGVLIYLLLADHDVEILADRGADSALSDEVWEQAVELIRQACAGEQYESGVIAAVEYLNGELARVYPPGDRNPDELPNRPVIV